MTPSYLHFNENYKPENGRHYVVLAGHTFVQTYTKFWTSRERARTRLNVSDGIFTLQRLKDRKRAWNPGNYTEIKYRLVEVGKKDRTKHLPEGKIYQLFPISE